MKKLIAMISAIAVIGTMSLTSFAAITVTPNAEDTNASLAKGATSGYDASYTSDKVNTQTTIVAVKGTEINTSSIQYINQLAQDSETVINFDLKDELAAGEIVTVYMGGDAIDKTKIGTIAKAAAVQKFTVTFYDEDGTTVLQTAEYESGDPLVAPTNLKTEDETHYYEFVGWLDKNSASSSTVELPANVTVNAEYVAVYNKTEKEVGGGEDTETVTISYQMVKVTLTNKLENETLTADATVSTVDLDKNAVIYSTLTEPVLSKHTFIGWYTDAELTTKLDKATVATEATTIYAKMLQTPLFGDIDWNGKVQARDYTAYKNYALYGTDNVGFGKEIKYTYNEDKGAAFKMGDIDKNGKLQARDYTAYKNYALYGTNTNGIGANYPIQKD